MVRTHNLTHKPMKFLCSYGGRIVPRYPDGKLRYYGGQTRVLSVGYSISFAGLLIKMGEMYGSPVSLRCQLPTDDLDALVSVTSDEDLANLIEEYDFAAAAAAAPLKIRAFLSAPKAVRRASPPPSASVSSCSSDASPQKSCFYSHGGGVPPRCPASNGRRRLSRPPGYPGASVKAAGKIQHQFGYGNGGGMVRLVHNGHHWQ